MRNMIFFTILLITIPLWLIILLLMMSYDIADNFRSQINKGHYPLMK